MNPFRTGHSPWIGKIYKHAKHITMHVVTYKHVFNIIIIILSEYIELSEYFELSEYIIWSMSSQPPVSKGLKRNVLVCDWTEYFPLIKG